MQKRLGSCLSVSMVMSFLLTLSPFAYAFNNSHFKGGYAFRLFGPSSVVLANQPLTVSSGVLVADGKGHVTGQGRFRSAGITCQGTITGNYTINTEGTGILTSAIQTSTPGCFTSVLDLALALAHRGEIFEASNTENDYLSGTFSRQGKTNFKLSDFEGSYALRLIGPSSVVRANQPLTVGVAVLNFDGRGKLIGKGTLRSAGGTCRGLFAGNYRINSDGTGTLTSHFATSDPGCYSTVVNLSMALFNKGNGAEVANIDNDYMIGTLTRQLPK
jgi:hypothetical protein